MKIEIYNMKFALYALSFIFLVSLEELNDVFLFNGGGNYTGTDLGQGKTVDKCLDLGTNQLTLIDTRSNFTTLPGKVSVFFRVIRITDGNPIFWHLTASQYYDTMSKERNDACSIEFLLLSQKEKKYAPNATAFFK